MTWTVEWDDRAAKELRKLDRQIQKEILSYFRGRIATAEDPRRFGKPLSRDLAGLWRYRVRDYRRPGGARGQLPLTIPHRSTRMAPFWNRYGAMPTLSIKNVPASVVERLRKRAERNHRSMQGELMALICDAVEPAPVDDRPQPARQTGTMSIEEIAAEHRARWAEPFDQGPRAVDLIRRDRDAR